jgi:hypothetical protein
VEKARTVKSSGWITALHCLAGIVLFGAAAVAAAETYEPGQIWTYKTRPQESASTLQILRVENTAKFGTVIFIGLKDVRIRHVNGKIVATMSPIPFAKSAIDQSVVKLVGKPDAIMPSDRGYLSWKASLLAGKTPRIYTKPVAETIKDIEDGSWMVQKEPVKQ